MSGVGLVAGEMLCPRCGYDLSGDPVGQCSECGLRLSTDILDIARRRSAYWRGRRVWSDALWGAAAVLYQPMLGPVVAALSGKDLLSAMLAASLAVCVFQGPGLLGVLAVVASAPRRSRVHWLGALLRVQPLMQTPFLAVATVGTIILAMQDDLSDLHLGFRFATLGTFGLGVGFLCLGLKRRWHLASRRAGVQTVAGLDPAVVTIAWISVVPTAGLLAYVLLGPPLLA